MKNPQPMYTLCLWALAALFAAGAVCLLHESPTVRADDPVAGQECGGQSAAIMAAPVSGQSSSLQPD